MNEPNIIRKPASPDMSYSEIELIHREVSLRADTLIARVIRLDGNEGMLSTHLSELLNISESGLRKHIRSRAIGAQTVVAHRMRSELGADVIPIFARLVLFLPKESVQEIVKIIDTPEAWAVYRQLWEYAEKFATLETERNQLQEQCRLLEAERDQALAHINLLQKDLATRDVKLEDLNARMAAADYHIALGGNKKSPKFTIPVYRREPNDIFNNPVYSIEIVKKAREEMNPDERHRFQTYHSTRTIVGLSLGLEKTFDQLGVTNDAARSMLSSVRESAIALKEQLEPCINGLFALNSAAPQAYMN